MNQEHIPFGRVPQRVVPDLTQAAFPQSSVHGIPTPNQPRPENLRQQTSRFWYHPDGEVLNVEMGTAGQYQFVIRLDAYRLMELLSSNMPLSPNP